MKTLARLAVMFVGLVVLGGCAPEARPKPYVAPGIPFDRVQVESNTLPAEIRGWLEANSRKKGVHVTDAGDKSYIMVAWGEKPTGGFTVHIRDVAQGRSGEVVVVELKAPKQDEMTTQAITYPFDVVSVPRLERRVTVAYIGNLTLQSPIPMASQPEPEKSSRETPQVARSKNFLVTSPAPGQVITSPVTITGKARVFEATFSIEIEDGHNILAEKVVMTDGGAPAFGNFNVILPFDKPTNPSGSIIFVTYSAEDGSRQEELILPVKFAIGTPGG